MKKIYIILLAICLTGMVACKENEPSEKITEKLGKEEQAGENGISVCGVNDPLTDLPWLKGFIDKFEKEAEESGYNHHARIHQCAYNGGIGFLLETCVGYPNDTYYFYNCEGNILCTGDLVYEAIRSGLNIDFENKVLIWEKEKSAKYYIYENHDISACGVNDPLRNLEWLKEFCQSINDSYFSTVSIELYKATDTKENVFLIESSFPIESTPEQGNIGYESEWRNCSGKLIFHISYPGTPPNPVGVENFMKDKVFIAELFSFDRQ